MIPVRRNLFEILEIESPDNKITNSFEKFMFILISLNIVVVILETVKGINNVLGTYFHWFDMFSLTVFTVEYLARMWVCTLDERYRPPVLGRLKYMFTPLMLLDLAIILPFYLPLFLAVDTRFILMFRVLRLARLLKLTRYSQSLQRLVRVTRNKKDDLVATVGIVFTLLIISSSMMYYVEHAAQPDKFSSIPAAMWWGVATLTTVGYGDLFPVTTWGKFIGGFIAILGIGMVALPTGIIGSGFLEELQVCRTEDRICPHCGKNIESHE